jgi:hypothetical protein
MIKKSPSELTKARFSMLFVAEKICVARPSLRVGSPGFVRMCGAKEGGKGIPEPAMVRRPETKSVSSLISNGSLRD